MLYSKFLLVIYFIHSENVSPSVRLFAYLTVIPCTEACQAPLSMKFSRQEYWSGQPFPSPEDLTQGLNLDFSHCRQILYQLSHQGSPLHSSMSVYFDYYSFIVESEVWEGYSSSFVLFSQDCFGNSGSFVVPYKF